MYFRNSRAAPRWLPQPQESEQCRRSCAQPPIAMVLTHSRQSDLTGAPF